MENHIVSMGKLTISMAIFNSYVSLPKGIFFQCLSWEGEMGEKDSEVCWGCISCKKQANIHDGDEKTINTPKLWRRNDCSKRLQCWPYPIFMLKRMYTYVYIWCISVDGMSGFLIWKGPAHPNHWNALATLSTFSVYATSAGFDQLLDGFSPRCLQVLRAPFF